MDHGKLHGEHRTKTRDDFITMTGNTRFKKNVLIGIKKGNG